MLTHESRRLPSWLIFDVRHKMKLAPPLSNLIGRCQTICVAECCGIDAYDFSPVQIASYLTMGRGAVDAKEVAVLKEQLASLSANHGVGAASSRGIAIEEMNQSFTAEAVDAFVEEIAANLGIAVDVVAESERRRFKARQPNQSVQHNAGSRPSSKDVPASETPSSLGPRG